MTSLLTANFGWKLASLALAALLWIAMVGVPDVTTSVSVPIVFQNLPRELEFASELPDRVRLEITGASGKLSPSELSDASVVINLAGVRAAGDRTFPIERENAMLPAGVQLERAQPSQVRLRLEPRLSREVPVQVRVGKFPGKGLEIISLQVEPQRLLISGPESSVREATSAETDPLDLSGISDTAEIPAHASTGDPRIRFTAGSRVTVRVQVKKNGEN
jgi:YbbR domain-containing protein